MRFNELINCVLESFLARMLPAGFKGKTKFVEPIVKAPTRRIDSKGWLKNNREWIPVVGVHGRPEYINQLNKGTGYKTVHSVSRDALENCILNGHTRVHVVGDTINIECRSLSTGKAALSILQRMFSNVDNKKIVVDALNEGSYDLDVEGRVIGRSPYRRSSQTYSIDY
jgi:hypothetical protein